MDNIAEHRHIICYHFHEGFNAAKTAHRICEVYGPDALKENVVRKWFVRFRVENFNVKNAKQSSRPRTVDMNKITTLVDANSHLMVREIQEVFDMSHGSIVAHLRDAGYVSKMYGCRTN